MEEKQIKFVVKIPMQQVDIIRIAGYLREGYRLVHDDEQEQQQESTKAQHA